MTHVEFASDVIHLHNIRTHIQKEYLIILLLKVCIIGIFIIFF